MISRLSLGRAGSGPQPLFVEGPALEGPQEAVGKGRATLSTPELRPGVGRGLEAAFQAVCDLDLKVLSSSGSAMRMARERVVQDRQPGLFTEEGVGRCCLSSGTGE
jgi:hypothetical protein